MTHLPEKNGKSATKKNGDKHAESLCAKNEPTQPPPPDGGWGWVVVFASFMVHIIIRCFKFIQLAFEALDNIFYVARLTGFPIKTLNAVVSIFCDQTYHFQSAAFTFTASLMFRIIGHAYLAVNEFFDSNTLTENSDGVTYSYGVFHIDFVKHFNTTNQAASWITSLLVGVTYCSGPISSFLVNKFGCRAVTIAGSVLASACLLVSVWAQSVVMLYFSAGIGTGFGFGLIYLPAIVSVTVYFEKYRSLATGIAVCGSGLGTVVFAPFISYLIWNFGGYKYAMMILSAIVLNCIIFGIMFRPLEPVKASECIPLKDVTKNGASTFPLSEGTKQGVDRCLSVSHISSKKHSNAKSIENNSNNIRLALSQPILMTKDGNQTSEPFARVSCGSGIMNRSDVFLRSSIHNIRKRSESLTNSDENARLRLSSRSLPNGAGHRMSEGADYPEDSNDENIIKRMLQFSLLRDPLFIIFTISNFCTSIGFNVPYVYLLPQAIEQGVDKDTASILLSVIGIANTLGRIILGYISDKPWVNRLLVYNLCLTICGLATAFSPFCTSFASFAIYASVYGFTAGAYVGLTSVCLVDLVGLERLTNAFGLVLLSQGIASFLGPPIAGVLSDTLKSYDPGFYVAGIMIAFSGVMLFIIPPIQKRMLKKSEKLQRIDTVA